MIKVKNKYDVVIIGSGLGGLVSANILAREGYSVCVLEKNNQFGGNLQAFIRDKNIFDTGLHYVGGLDKGQNLNKYFNYLGILEDLKLHKLDEEKFDVVTFDNDSSEYYHAQGYEKFSKSLIKQFPEEKEAIITYCKKIQDVCNSFPLYNVDAEIKDYDLSNLSLKIKDYIDSITENSKLKAVLAGSNILYAGDENTPLYVHALSVDSYIRSSWRFIKGGGQIAKLLVKKLKEFGGEAYKYQEVIKFIFEGDELTSVLTEKGKIVEADIFISNIEPKLTLKMLEGKGMRKSYVNRINQIKSVISGFSLYIVFKPKTFPYLNYNYYHHKSSNKIWGTQNYSKTSWPETYMLSMGVPENQYEWADSLTAMTYMRFEDVQKWEQTFNTVVKKSERDELYKEFKREKTEIFLIELEKKFPNIRECIQSTHTSTPLSYRDYIGSNEGAMYGFVKDANNPLRSLLSPNTKVKNLFFTGQSLNMHGILGVTISAVLTCSQIVGREKLLGKINNALIE